MPEELLVRYCSPTLAGIKTGNLFSCFCESVDKMREVVRDWNKLLRGKGLRILPLNYKNNRALIYVYRPGKLKNDLEDNRAERILSERGYFCDNCRNCISHLRKRMTESEEFPHEIGLFLGYPPEDVCGFIENKAECCKCVGCWKVYGDEEGAKKTFEKYKKCTEEYCNLFANGRSIERLTVAV
ncbi:MAG: DUF3793 family protein [Oscillospiraceae bacterium]|nr:DUF3793 family protein [Oscillospiraceae bacterium]MBQ8883441.1 DUF3793 family protein [Oscillospiraceae bacterium]